MLKSTIHHLKLYSDHLKLYYNLDTSISVIITNTSMDYRSISLGPTQIIFTTETNHPAVIRNINNIVSYSCQRRNCKFAMTRANIKSSNKTNIVLNHQTHQDTIKYAERLQMPSQADGSLTNSGTKSLGL